MRLSRRQLLVSLPATLAAGGTAVARTEATCGAGRRAIRLLLTGDVMCGRGVDRILPHPSDPRIFEPRVRDARDHVRLAERAHGEIGGGDTAP